MKRKIWNQLVGEYWKYYVILGIIGIITYFLKIYSVCYAAGILLLLHQIFITFLNIKNAIFWEEKIDRIYYRVIIRPLIRTIVFAAVGAALAWHFHWNIMATAILLICIHSLFIARRQYKYQKR